LVLFATYTSELSAQTYLAQKYKLARSFEQSGDFVNASRLYLELYGSDEQNENYFNGYIRAMKEQNKFSAIIPFVEKHIIKIPTSDNYTLLGELYWRAGKAEKAETVWAKAINAESNSQMTYENLAMTQISLRLFQKAIDTYVLGRKNLNTAELFADRLSQLYSINGDYRNGTREVLILYAQTGNIALAEGRLSALNINPDAEKYIYSILKDKSDKLAYKQLFAWFLTSLDRNEEAIEIYKEIDNERHSRGRDVYNFALNAANDGNYDIAIKGLQWLIAKGKESPFTVSALFKLAKTTEMKFMQAGKLEGETAESIIKQYRSVIEEYPDTPTALECTYNIALLYKRLGKLDKALIELDKLVNLRHYTRYKVSATLMQADIYFMKNETDKAILAYKFIVDVYKRSVKEHNQALYSLAEIEYFKGNMDSALAHFTKITLNTDSDVANDALEKISLIEANKNFNKALSLYAQAEKNEKQEKLQNALELFLTAAKSSKPENLYDLSLIKAAKIELKLGKTHNSIEHLSELLKDKAKGIHKDYCLFTIGEILFTEKKYEQAIEYFTKLLKEEPKSIYNENARDYIRQIRNRTN